MHSVHMGGDTIGADTGWELPDALRTIIPRWECRWVDVEPPVAESRLKIDESAMPETTVETYFVSLRTPHNVKIRHGVIDIKRLQRICGDGLELWAPTLQSSFPIDPPALAEVCGAWGVRLLDPLPPAITHHEFDHFVDTLDDVRRITVTKHRLRLDHGGCPGELVSIEVAGEHWMSLAFEHEDRSLIRAVLVDLGLDPRLNLNCPAALKRLFSLPLPTAHVTARAR